MIVATGTSDGDAHQTASDEVDAVVDNIVWVIAKPTAYGEEAECRQRAFVFAEVHAIRRELLLQKRIVRLVFVEGSNDIFAESVGVRVIDILGKHVTLGVRIACEVEPVSAPAFAVLRRREQAIDQAFVGVRRLVVRERIGFVGSRWQAGQIEADAANQRSRVGERRGRKAMLFPLCREEAIDRVSSIGYQFGLRHDGIANRLERPVRFTQCGSIADLHAVSGEGGTDLHPLGQCRHRLRGQRLARRHRVFAFSANGLYQQALGRIAGNDHRPRVGAFFQPGCGIEAQPRFLLLRTVALDAVVDEDRADFLLEELDLLIRRFGRDDRATDERQYRCVDQTHNGNGL